MKRSWILLACLLTGCTSTGPHPGLINGKYYMGGDPACMRAIPVPGTDKIECADAANNLTGYRDPMTPADMQMYSMQQQTEAMEDAARSARISAMQVPQIQAPVYQPMQITQPAPLRLGGGNQVRCLRTGIYTRCQ